jgi:two-component system cell cycle response regulator
LIVVSDLLQKRLRRTDKIGRYGEDEFLVVVAHVPFENVHALGSKLLKRIEEATAKDRRLPRGATVSAGISRMTDRMKNCHDLIEAADLALYEAKQAGKNRVSTASEEP